MNRAQAKQILLLYRPGTQDGEDAEVCQAMELARQDPELAGWFEQHQAFQDAMRAKLRQTEVPGQFKASLLAAHKTVHLPAFGQRPLWIAAAAIFILLFGLAIALLRPRVPDRFADYRETMVSAAVRVYGMDLETNSQTQLRQFLARNDAPADYQLTAGLENLPLKGGGLQRWRGNPVSMVCFDRGRKGMLFLFVLKRTALKDAPPETTAAAQPAKVEGLATVSWTKGDDTYLLAGREEPGFAQKYVP